MSVEFLSFQNMAANQNENKGVFARFYDKTVKTGNIKENGLPEFENKLYIEIKIRDERDVFDQPANQEHIKRFAFEYQRYLNEKQKTKDGTALEMFAFLEPSQIESCHLRGVFTLEDLEKLKDEQARDLGISQEKELAEKFLKTAKNNKSLFDFLQKEKMYQEEIKALKEEIERLKFSEK